MDLKLTHKLVNMFLNLLQQQSVSKQHIMKTYRCKEIQFHTFLTLALDAGESINFIQITVSKINYCRI